jgi:glycosyltransferase 2 family protein
MPPGVSAPLVRVLQAGAPVVISAAILIWIGQGMDWQAVATDALRAPVWAVATCIALVFLQLALCGARLAALSASVGAPIGRGAATATWGFAHLAGMTLPSSVGAELVKGGLLLRWIRHPGRIIAVLMLERFLALAAMGLVVLSAAPFLAAAAHRPETPWIALVSVLGLASTASAFLLRRRLFALLRGILDRTRVPVNVRDGVDRALAAAPLGSMTAVSVLVHLLTLGMIGVLATGLGLANPWLVALLGGPIVVFASMLPISIGGLGVREGAAIAVFGALGAAPGQAASVALALWGSQVLAGALAATAGFLWLLLRRPDSARQRLAVSGRRA